MKRFTLIFLTLLWCCCSFGAANAQTVPFQNAVGSQAAEELWDALYDNNTQLFVTVGSGNIANNVADIWISQYQPNGTQVSSNRLQFPAGTPQGYFAARSICETVFNPAVGPSYFITGIHIGAANPATGATGRPQQFVARVTGTGTVLWFRMAYLQPAANAQSEGIAVELMANGDVIAVGNAQDYQGWNNVVATRFSQNGVLGWTRYYARRTAPYIAREATKAIYSQPCTAGADEGVIVVGEVRGEPFLGNYGVLERSFAMHIDGSGSECWRFGYPSGYQNNPLGGPGYLSDAAYDIVPNGQVPGAVGTYSVVGRADYAPTPGTNTPNGSGIYTFQINGNGFWLCGNVYGDYNAAGNLSSNLFARSVSASLQPGNIIVTGPRNQSNDVFIAEFPANCQLQPAVWAKHYQNWGTDALNTPLPGILQGGVPESVHIANTQSPTYFVTGNTDPGLHGQRDGHLLNTDGAGNTPGQCQPVPFTLIPTFAGENFQLPGVPEPLLTWQSPQVVTAVYPTFDSICGAIQTPCTVNASFTTTFNACSGTVTATSTSTGNGTLSYLWNNGATTATTTFTVPAGAPFVSVCLYVTNVLANGTVCTDTICQPVQVPAANPILVNIGFQSTCTQGFLNAFATGGTAPYTYVWNNGATTTNITVNASGLYCVTATDANGCTASACRQVNIGANINVTISQQLTCGNATLTTVLPAGTTGSYLWTNGATTQSITVNASGTYCVTVTTANGCTATACTNVTIPNPMVATFTFTPVANNCLRLNFTSAVSGGTAPYTYSWSFPGATPATSTTANPTNITYPTAGGYAACVTITDANGCTATYCQQFTVGQPCNLNNVDFCTLVEPFGTTGFRVTINGVQHNCNGTATIQYSFNGGATWTNANTATFTTPGIINVCVRVTCTVCGQTCSRTCCKEVQINAPCNIPATATLSASVNQGTGVVTFTSTALSPAAAGYDWDFNNDGIVDATTASPSTTFTYPQGTHTACVTIRRSGNCTKTICRTFVVEGLCNVTANYSARHCTNAPLTVTFTSILTNATSVLWNFGDGNTSVLNNPTHTYAAPGSYTVCLTAQNSPSCRMRVCYTVIVAPKVCTSPRPLGMETNDNGNEQAEEALNPMIENDGADAQTVPVVDGLSLFPNPAGDQTNLVFELGTAQDVQVLLTDMTGKTVQTIQTAATNGQNVVNIPTGSLGQGLYLVRLNAGGTIRTAKLMINR